MIKDRGLLQSSSSPIIRKNQTSQCLALYIHNDTCIHWINNTCTYCINVRYMYIDRMLMLVAWICQFIWYIQLYPDGSMAIEVIRLRTKSERSFGTALSKNCLMLKEDFLFGRGADLLCSLGSGWCSSWKWGSSNIHQQICHIQKQWFRKWLKLSHKLYLVDVNVKDNKYYFTETV